MRLHTKWIAIGIIATLFIAGYIYVVWRARLTYSLETRLAQVELKLNAAIAEKYPEHELIDKRLELIEATLLIEYIPRARETQRPISPTEAWQRNRDIQIQKRLQRIELELFGRK